MITNNTLTLDELRKIQQDIQDDAIARCGGLAKLKEIQKDILAEASKSVATQSHADIENTTQRALQYVLDVAVNERIARLQAEGKL
jgi:hypothetical protein